MANRDNWIIIGISGVTCGGKTTLANRLKAALSPAHVFHQDKYFYPDDSPKHVRCHGLEHNNYDILSALDMEAMYEDIVSTMAGRDKSHAHDQCGHITAPGKRFLVIEGFTVLNYKKILDLCDLRYYLILSYEECWARRVLRLYEPPDIDGYFDQCVWPEHLKYRAQIEKDGRVKLLYGTEPNVIDLVLADIKQHIDARCTS